MFAKGNKMKIKIKIKLLHPNAIVPERKHELDAGFDIFAVEEVKLYRGQQKLLDCGFAMELPPGYEAQVRPRSGLATKHGITVINSPATIDSGYRGVIKVGLVKIGGSWAYIIKPGDRIAQMVVKKLPEVEFECVDSLNDTDRGAGGFGSTGF